MRSFVGDSRVVNTLGNLQVISTVMHILYAHGYKAWVKIGIIETIVNMLEIFSLVLVTNTFTHDFT